MGDLLVCGGLHFSRGGLDFEEGKSLFWHWIIPIFKKKSPANIPFYVLERQKCVNLPKNLPDPWGCWIYRIQVEDLKRAEGINSGGWD